MIWKNAFLFRENERINSEIFLDLFSAQALNFINEERFTKVQFIRSSPGAGKTTVFKALQPYILEYLQDNENLKDFYKIASDNKIIENGQIKLLSCLISCAKNYNILDELFKNGRKQQVLFALLNVRITILALKGILTIKTIKKPEDLCRITFKNYPEELGIIEENIHNGYDLYNWARSEEKRICDYIDSLSDEKTNFTLYYNNLFFIKLFEPNNILFDGEEFLNYTLIIFDDMQKLTSYQRKLLIDCFLTMRPNMGIWLGERLEALSADELLLSDAYDGREYQIIELEDYWRNQGNDASFKKVLTNIADRRVRLSNKEVGSFSNCIKESIDYEQYSENLTFVVKEIKKAIKSDKIFGQQFTNIIELIDDKYSDLYERALNLSLLEIIYLRESRQIKFDMSEPYSIDNFGKFIKDSNNRNAAEFYLCMRSKIPYYYGIDRLKEISSYNIEQFLSFSSILFEKSISKRIIQIGKKDNYLVGADDQERYIREIAKVRWNDILRRFQNGDKIQIFLNNLCTLAQKTRDSGTNPYTGGAATGIAIAIDDIPVLKKNYPLLKKIITDCLSSNYFEKRIQEHGNRKWLVLYFNRWLCVKYSLPLKYGGWRKMNLEKLSMAVFNANLFSKNIVMEEEQYQDQIDMDISEVLNDEK